MSVKQPLIPRVRPKVFEGRNRIPFDIMAIRQAHLPSTYKDAGGGSPSFSTKSLNFDGVQEYVDASVLLPLLDTTKGSWAGWVRTTDVSVSQIIASVSNSASPVQILWYNFGGKIRAEAYQSGQTRWRVETDNVVLSDDTWHHVVLTHNNVEAKLYVDGQFPDQAFPVSTNKALWIDGYGGLNTCLIGARKINGNSADLLWDGNIDEFIFGTTDFPAATVTDMYNSGEPKDETGLTGAVAWYRKGDGSGDNYDSDTANEWTFEDQIGSNDISTVNAELEDVETVAP